jgi:glycosyltransferase involved in cell wall biosynthesis
MFIEYKQKLPFWILIPKKSQLILSLNRRQNHKSSLDRSKQKNRKVIMLGPSLDEQGGMGAVCSLIMQSTIAEIDLEHISTWDGKQSKKSKINILKVFAIALSQIIWQLCRGKVDLLHLHLSERGSALRNGILILIARLFRKPVIIHAHGAEFPEFYKQLSPRWQQILSWILQQSTYFIALSESWKKYYISECGLAEEQVIVLHNPVNFPSQIPDRTNTEEINLTFLGKINQRKGVYDLLQAFANLNSESRQKAKLIIAGSGEIEAANNLAKQLQINEKVDFIGWINTEQKNNLLANTSIFLLPSYNEGLPMALLEAMSWGLPVITTPVGGIREVVVDNQTGILVTPGNIHELTSRIESLINNAVLRLNIGRAARETTAAFSIDKYSKSLFALYCSALEKSKN